jgi:hypothetical protein
MAESIVDKLVGGQVVVGNQGMHEPVDIFGSTRSSEGDEMVKAVGGHGEIPFRKAHGWHILIRLTYDINNIYV